MSGLPGTLLCRTLAVLCLPWAAGCTSPPEARDARWLAVKPLPHVVHVVLPANLAAPEPPALPLDSARLARAIRMEFERLRVCTHVEVLEGKTAPPAAREPATLDSAPDLVIEIEAARPPSYAFSYRNGWFVPNMLLWFFAGFPSFWIRDRVYDVNWEMRFRARGPSGMVLREILHPLSEERPLQVAERGWTAQVLYTPPGFYEGPHAEKPLATFTEDWLVRSLVDFLKSEGGALPFEVRIGIEWPENLGELPAGRRSALRASVSSPSPLERLRVELDGVSIWERDALTMMKAARVPRPDGRGELYAYNLEIPFSARQGPHRLRLMALRSGGPESASDDGSAWSASMTVRFSVGLDGTRSEDRVARRRGDRDQAPVAIR